MKRRLVVGFVACLLATAGCGEGSRERADASSDAAAERPTGEDADGAGEGAAGEGAGGETDGGDEAGTGAAVAGGTLTEFGDLPFPCGPRDGGGELPASDAGDTFGIGDDGIRIGTFADPGYVAVPGLNKELFDASEAFVAECNEAGGINGRPIVWTPRDAAVLEYSTRVAEACAEDFAVVGGGAVLDETGAQALTDCGLVGVPGFSATAKAALADNVVPPIPNPPHIRSVAGLIQLRDAITNGEIDGVDADGVNRMGILYGEIQTTIDVKDQVLRSAEALGFQVVYEASYNIIGEANWAPFASAIADAGVEVFAFVGSPDFLIQLQQAMDTAGNAPAIIVQEGNFYDGDYGQGIAGLNPDTLNLVRSIYWPLERAGENPATQAYLDLLDRHVPDAEIAELGMASTSAWLLFAGVAAECDRQNELSRSCVYNTAKAIESWTGGGLHQAANPSAFTPPECGLLLQVAGGTFEIWNPQGDTPETAFFCPEQDALVEIENTFGEGAVSGGS